MTVAVIGTTVMCGSCRSPMKPIHVHYLDEQLDWLFWRCTIDRDHVSVPLPLPRSTRL